jgi:hypothetical protein
MAFESDLSEFFDPSEFGENITHQGNTIAVMFFDVREEVENIYINHTYMTMPKSSLGAIQRGDTITRGNIEYRVKSITDHNSDKTIKVVELDYIRELN